MDIPMINDSYNLKYYILYQLLWFLTITNLQIYVWPPNNASGLECVS